MSLALEGRVEILAVQYPGRQDRYAEPYVQSVDELVDAALDALAPRLADGRPVGLFGHSMGAVLAFEAARRLSGAGISPAALFVSARQGPSLPWPSDDMPRLHEADDDTLVADLRLLGGVEDELLEHPELLGLLLPTLRADHMALSKYEYRPGGMLQCPVVAFAGESDPRVPVDNVRSWRHEAHNSFDLHVLPGGGTFILRSSCPAW
ncbi:thioesterase II family protein [Streptomyces sp. NPDC057375]|uniref:thioesterase II family protein n=1 Tax=Streptomyces sp. NPDC057375 TaxID=3346109 RepID=UPI0036328ED8